MPSRPLADFASPFIDRTEASNLPQSPQSVQDYVSDGGQTEIEVTDYPMTEWGVPTSSQSLGAWAPDQPRSPHPLPRPTSAQSSRSENTQVEDQLEAQVEDQQPGETLDVLPLRQSNVRTSPPITTTRPSTRPAGHRSGPYRTRLNITEINLARRLTQTPRTTVGTVHPPQVSTHVNSTSQHHSSQPNPTPNPAPAPRSSSQHRLLRNQSIQAPSLPSQPEPEPQPALQAQADTDLLEDNEEERAILGAMATCTIALRKKRKPAMSDLDGEERHIVLVVRDLVLVYSVVYNDELVPASDEMCAVVSFIHLRL
ncbi:hypothetical protein RSOL_353060, partial [Rhizoctonia solani AG-3 Rhs1AP]